jgi:hypothetical protein
VDDILEAAHQEITESLGAAATQALGAGDEEGVADALGALQGHTGRLLSRFRSAMVPPRLRLWYQAGLLECFELAASCQEALGQDPAASLLACLNAVAEVSTGSDLHVITASKYLQLLERRQQEEEARGHQGAGGAGDEAWREQQRRRLAAAAAGCRAAHRARYGDVSGLLYERLAELNRTLYE